MIEIKVDKESEMIWLNRVLSAGKCNMTTPYTLLYLGVELKQNITFKPSDIYEDDIKEKRDEFNKRFANMRGMDIERILREELIGKG